MLKKHPHTPAHLFLNDTSYFLTGAIYQKRHLLKSAELKVLLLQQIKTYFQKYEWQLEHWVILDNHYHLLGRSKLGSELSQIMQGIHGSTSSAIKKNTHADKPIWWNYWDRCPRDSRDYYIRLNYLLWNPVKHGYVENLDNYSFSSYHQLVAEEGKSKIQQQFCDYPEYKDLILTEALDDDF